MQWDVTWTGLDAAYPNLVVSYTIDRGRRFETDRTDTGRAVVRVADPDGILDPTNSTGPYYTWIEPLVQAAIARYNPVTSTWSTRFRGFVEELDYVYDPSQQVSFLNISLVDIFEILSATAMLPAVFSGGTPPVEATGQVYFPTDAMDDRMTAILGNSSIPADFYVVFSGNVTVQTTTYSTGESAMTAIQEAADAEFPGVSNVYGDRYGRLAVHGRLAKFDPSGTWTSSFYTAWSGATAYTVGARVRSGGLSYECILNHTNHVPPNATYWKLIPGKWDWNHWHAGDGAAVAGSPTTVAHIRRFAFNRGRARIINSAIATPFGIDDADVDGQAVTDSTSISQFGIRSWEAQNLITLHGTSGPGYTALEETHKFADFYVANFAEPRNRITDIAFRTMQPTATGAAILWSLLSSIDVGDRVDVTVTGPSGGAAFNEEPFFVEGIHEDVRPLNATYDDITLSLDLSPMAYFTDGSMFADDA